MHLLITGAWAGAQKYKDELEAMGHEVCFIRSGKDPLPCDYDWVEGLIGNGIFLAHPIEKFTNLRYIQLVSVGYDRIPMDYVAEHGIEIHNIGGVYSVPMAEYALMGVLMLYKKMREFEANRQAKVWEKRADVLELFGKTVCIVGVGAVGTESAKRFKAFGCKVIGVNRTVRDAAGFDEVRPMSELDAVLSTADVVLLAVPNTPETRHLMNEERLSLLKPTAVLVNVARGVIVDTEALLRHIDNIGGAVLDVFEEEPLPADSSLWEKENVLLTPHNSFMGDGNPARTKEEIMRNLRGLNCDYIGKE